jgi:hypothetical protein
MTEGEKPSGMGAGKIVLIVVAVLVVLGILCCGVGAFLARDKISQGVAFGKATAAFQERLVKDFGMGTLMTFAPDDDGMVLLVGVRPAPEPERIAELQDKAWRAYCESFAEGGIFVTSVAIGESATAANTNKTPVLKWRKNMISVADLEARTGVKAPPPSQLFEGMEGPNVQVGTSSEEEEEAPAGEDAPK